jgi:carbonic anhydrase
MPPNKLPKSLVEGHRRFLRDRHAPERARYRQLAELGQAPTAMIIACCDARVDVSTVFDAGPGELFTLRNVANLVPPYEAEGKYHGTSAAIEFAILTLKVPHLIPTRTFSLWRRGSVSANSQREGHPATGLYWPPAHPPE